MQCSQVPFGRAHIQLPLIRNAPRGNSTELNLSPRNAPGTIRYSSEFSLRNLAVQRGVLAPSLRIISCAVIASLIAAWQKLRRYCNAIRAPPVTAQEIKFKVGHIWPHKTGTVSRIRPLFSAGAKGAESGGKRGQIRRSFHPDVQILCTIFSIRVKRAPKPVPVNCQACHFYLTEPGCASGLYIRHDPRNHPTC
jgi:hypothetical protein